MAHEVTMDISTKFVLHKDVTVEIKKDGYKLGTVLISKGNIEWVPSSNYANKKRLYWAKCSEHGNRGQRRANRRVENARLLLLPLSKETGVG